MDTADWLTKAQAAQAIGVSEKTIEGLAKAKKLQQGRRPRPGLPPQAVYHPADVERVRRERNPPPAQPFLFPPDKPEAALPPPAKPHAPAPLRERVRLAEKVYLTLAEAVEYSGLGRVSLLKLVLDGQLAMRKGAGPRQADVLRRADLDAL